MGDIVRVLCFFLDFRLHEHLGQRAKDFLTGKGLGVFFEKEASFLCCAADGLGGHVFKVLDFGMELFLFIFSEDFLDLGELLGEGEGAGFLVGFGSEFDGFGVHGGK